MVFFIFNVIFIKKNCFKYKILVKRGTCTFDDAAGLAIPTRMNTRSGGMTGVGKTITFVNQQQLLQLRGKVSCTYGCCWFRITL
jgi:hypothetical protein